MREECSSIKASRGGPEPRLLGGGRSGFEAQWRHLVAGARAALGAGSGIRGSGGCAAPAPRARVHPAIDQLPPTRPFWQTSPPGGGRASDTGPRGSAMGPEGSVPLHPDIKNASGIYSITFINIIILFPVCQALIRDVGACAPRLVQMGRQGSAEGRPPKARVAGLHLGSRGARPRARAAPRAGRGRKRRLLGLGLPLIAAGRHWTPPRI